MLLFPLAFFVAMLTQNQTLLYYSHVMPAILWTGTEIFMGLVLGPILQKLPIEARKPVLTSLFPKVFWILPISAMTTGTAGWFLAHQMKDIIPGHPWPIPLIFAAVIVAVLTIQGFGFLLPTNYQIYRMMRSGTPPTREQAQLLQRRMAAYRVGVTVQALAQFAIITVMVILAA
ncbi:hypothetical protein BXT84_10980 [Sulfobacillus thermotolerans]|uniref:DUF4149 domain-containing protein n=1 Tax=Sulfobacillus thermotolerans TaxID=338644 RepID=A0ABN5H4D7_9FIRM|nr:hypothetical protein BXT84_10980 [Sulfobacillus thermotolerans]